ncbi:hypothetical protein ZHAS_00017711 [Anopheles sinensis]|uniref:Uncharacterized protein n=1 Tax=Anopheles sinensis TaxID=74873 RepID=A0A084WH14_ANOSI|nr:hypothetical protein ZHAS_00017711 [Anopheles sinensis]
MGKIDSGNHRTTRDERILPTASNVPSQSSGYADDVCPPTRDHPPTGVGHHIQLKAITISKSQTVGKWKRKPTTNSKGSSAGIGIYMLHCVLRPPGIAKLGTRGSSKGNLDGWNLPPEVRWRGLILQPSDDENNIIFDGAPAPSGCSRNDSPGSGRTQTLTVTFHP